MNLESEVSEPIELKLPSVSPTMQSDDLSVDADTSTMHISSIDKLPPSPTEDPSNSEPKAKKRRKQSNPLKIQNPESPKFGIEEPESTEATETEATYPFDNVLQNHVIEKSRTPDSGSQKGSLSRVTDALFNNKLREAAKASTNSSSKSKDSSLQSLTDLSSPESSEDMSNNNNDFKNAMLMAYPQLPAMLPINPMDVARDSLKMGGGYPFGDFSTSLQHGNVNLSVSQRSFVTSSGVRVFNPEAYCELCEKEFCNKYFLKTHKANKHGICSNDNNNSPGYTYKNAFKSMPMAPQTTQQMITQMCETGATFGSADSYCNICQKYFCNKYFLKKHRQNIHGILEEQVAIPSSIHVPVISSPLPIVMRTISIDSKIAENSSGKSTKDEESKINVSMENIKNSLISNIPLVNGSSPHTLQSKSQAQSINQKDKKNEKFLCELCNIEFCDKCYLDAHRLNKHGQGKMASTEFPDFAEVGKVENNEKSSPTEDFDESKDFKGQMCAPCMKNFTSAETFQHHMLEVHGASLKDEEDSVRIESSELLHKKNGHSSFDSEGMMESANKSPSSHENSNSSTDFVSYTCGICMVKCRDKKGLLTHLECEHNILGAAALDMCLLQESLACEVCQEQFLDRIALLSHKFKVHGIVPPGLETYSEGIENGEYSFYAGNSRKSGGSSFCKFCNKELCNKYFMKTHMMKMHGIDVDKANQQPQPEKSPAVAATASGGVYCDICQKFLCSKYFLKVHKQNVHNIIDDSIKVSMVGSPSFGNVPANDHKMDWNSSYPSSAKLNNGHPDPEEMLKRNNNTIFTCDICGQEFNDKILLQVHLVNKHVKSSEAKIYPNGMYNHSPEESRDFSQEDLLPCSCCLFVNLDDASKLGNPDANLIISCAMCNITYSQNDYHTHHLSHGIAKDHLPVVENGIHDYHGNGEKPRKLKRFRCSKCDKTFRTKLRCLHHIQVTHKSKKGLDATSPPSKKNSPIKKITENGIEDHEDEVLPYKLPKDKKDVIMQPFHLSEPSSDRSVFVPSLVYLPVSQKVSETLTVAFTLTPA
ncbi:hypothetical protein JTE90_021344 [Oedothorax gibbosus]|uniref:C2H2-type domain-containing protein n=1 Tax=Oedothorax gibbosus TaxID=931172 RepID=A0AAV6TW87_9ARAC|nr:hypothetical protein JTE90_021344 [Oedothorax gibbosus]